MEELACVVNTSIGMEDEEAGEKRHRGAVNTLELCTCIYTRLP